MGELYDVDVLEWSEHQARLLRQAPVLIAVHVAASSRDLLGGILNTGGPLPAGTAVDGEPLQDGRIYVAPADHHLLIARTVPANTGAAQRS